MTHQDTGRFEGLILPHLDDAYTLARYLLRDEHDAQDAVQDAGLRAFQYFGSYRDGDARAWFLVIVRNCCHDRRRKRIDRVTEQLVDDQIPTLRDSDGADTAAIIDSERTAVARCVAALPVEFREVVVLREIQQLSYSEISDIVGVPIGTVMSRLARARKRLAAMLGGNAKEAG